MNVQLAENHIFMNESGAQGALHGVSTEFVLIVYTLYIGTNLKHPLSHTLQATCGTFLAMRTNTLLTRCKQRAVHSLQ